jgi:hypothetical protein
LPTVGSLGSAALTSGTAIDDHQVAGIAHAPSLGQRFKLATPSPAREAHPEETIGLG